MKGSLTTAARNVLAYLTLWMYNIAAALSTNTAPIPVVQRRSRRAVTFLEYAFMAGIIVIVGVIVLQATTGLLTDLWKNIESKWSNTIG